MPGINALVSDDVDDDFYDLNDTSNHDYDKNWVHVKPLSKKDFERVDDVLYHRECRTQLKYLLFTENITKFKYKIDYSIALMPQNDKFYAKIIKKWKIELFVVSETNVCREPACGRQAK